MSQSIWDLAVNLVEVESVKACKPGILKPPDERTSLPARRGE